MDIGSLYSKTKGLTPLVLMWNHRCMHNSRLVLEIALEGEKLCILCAFIILYGYLGKESDKCFGLDSSFAIQAPLRMIFLAFCFKAPNPFSFLE